MRRQAVQSASMPPGTKPGKLMLTSAIWEVVVVVAGTGTDTGKGTATTAAHLWT